MYSTVPRWLLLGRVLMWLRLTIKLWLWLSVDTHNP